MKLFKYQIEEGDTRLAERRPKDTAPFAVVLTDYAVNLFKNTALFRNNTFTDQMWVQLIGYAPKFPESDPVPFLLLNILENWDQFKPKEGRDNSGAVDFDYDFTRRERGTVRATRDVRYYGVTSISVERMLELWDEAEEDEYTFKDLVHDKCYDIAYEDMYEGDCETISEDVDWDTYDEDDGDVIDSDMNYPDCEDFLTEQGLI